MKRGRTDTTGLGVCQSSAARFYREVFFCSPGGRCFFEFLYKTLSTRQGSLCARIECMDEEK